MPPKKIKVLQVMIYMEGGGNEALVVNLQKRLPPHITFDYVLAHPATRRSIVQELGATVHVMPPEMRSPLRWATYVEQLVREHRYDVVHFHRFAFSGNVMKAAKQAGAAGRIAHSHRTNSQDVALPMRWFYNTYHWTINRWLLAQHATNIVGCSGEALRFVMGSFDKTPKCRVVINGIQIDDFANNVGSTPKENISERYGIPAGATVIGNLARLEPVKNHEFLLRVFDTLVKRNKKNLAGTPALNKVVMFIGGEGSLRAKLEHDRKQLSLQNRVFMPGYCTNVPELLGNFFDCFVTPTKMEGLPVSLIEAVAGGLHVVCSDVITKDITGAFPDRFTTLPLSAPLEHWAEAIEDAVQRRIPPEQGLELVRRSPMTFDHFAEEMIKIYESHSEPKSSD